LSAISEKSSESLPRILVTGGAGYIGSHTAVDLAASGYDPVVVDDFSNSERFVLDRLATIIGRPIRAHEVDCRDRAALARVFEEEAPVAGVIHFAAAKAVAESQAKPLHYWSNNVGSLVTLLEVMLERGVRDLVFSSSCTVYGQPDALPVRETSPIAEPASVYGATKQVCERLLQDTIASGVELRAMLLRYFNPIGAHPSGELGELPRGEPQNLVPVILRSAAGLTGPVRVHGGDWSTPDGTCIRDYIHVMDLAAAHVASLEWMAGQPDAPIVEALNVGTGRGTSVREALDAFERATGESVAFEIGPRREGDIEQIWAGVERAERMLGWKARRSVEEAMRDAWRWQCALGEAQRG
jgi:UDP-glucose 4-epimerase